MDVYIVIMFCLSSFGFFIILFSLYLLVTVPTKLTVLSRLAAHGHNFTSGIAQLNLTLGTVPCIIFPCVSGYTKGLHQYSGLSTITQGWIQVILVSMGGSFSLLLAINRVLAISMQIPNKKKNFMLTVFFAQAFLQIIFLAVAGPTVQDGGEDARRLCMEILPYEYPQEMYTMNGVNIVPSKDIGLKLILYYMATFSTFYLVVSGICGVILIRSIRNQGKCSQSAQFLACQRRITIGVIYFVFLELVGLGIPIICVALCSILNAGNIAVSYYACISMSVYPIFGPYYVLMSNKDYRNKVDTVVKNGITNGLRKYITST